MPTTRPRHLRCRRRGAAYDALTQKAKAEISQTLLNKLEAAEEKIEFYEKIDAAKKLLKELPAVNKNKVPTSSLIRQVRKPQTHMRS